MSRKSFRNTNEIFAFFAKRFVCWKPYHGKTIVYVDDTVPSIIISKKNEHVFIFSDNLSNYNSTKFFLETFSRICCFLEQFILNLFPQNMTISL